MCSYCRNPFPRRDRGIWVLPEKSSKSVAERRGLETHSGSFPSSGSWGSLTVNKVAHHHHNSPLLSSTEEHSVAPVAGRGATRRWAEGPWVEGMLSRGSRDTPPTGAASAGTGCSASSWEQALPRDRWAFSSEPKVLPAGQGFHLPSRGHQGHQHPLPSPASAAFSDSAGWVLPYRDGGCCPFGTKLCQT